MPNIDMLFVFSIPRAGTNHMFYFMQNIKSLDVRFEVYHPMEAYSISRYEVDLLSNLAGYRFMSNKDKNFIKWIHEYPLLFLKFLSERSFANDKSLIFKIFPNHINKNQIEKMIMDQPSSKAIIVNRRPVDSFISLVKSIHSGKYLNIDTSNIIVKLDSSYFMEWWVKNYNWYRSVESILTKLGVPYTYFNYENDIYCSNQELGRNITEAFLRIGKTIEFKNDLENQGLRKQDLEPKYENKVSNWKQFVSELKRFNFIENAFRPF